MQFLSTAFLLLVCLAGPQTPSPSSLPKPEPVAPMVKQQFGPTFSVATTLQLALITADFNGDGVDDVAIVADSNDPLPDSFQYKYEVADPYNSYFGFGNPKITVSYNKNDPGHNHDVLVIFGAGAEAWRSATPKAKFVLINVPFDKIEVGRMLVKKNKPPIFVIKALEAKLMDSAVYWDAKKKRWRWEPGDTIE